MALEQELGEVSRLQSVAAEFGRRELEEELRSVEATLHQLGVARVRSLLLWLEEQPLARRPDWLHPALAEHLLQGATSFLARERERVAEWRAQGPGMPGAFSQEEDRAIQAWVDRHGPTGWAQLAFNLGRSYRGAGPSVCQRHQVLVGGQEGGQGTGGTEYSMLRGVLARGKYCHLENSRHRTEVAAYRAWLGEIVASDGLGPMLQMLGRGRGAPLTYSLEEMQCSQNFMRVRFCKNAGIMWVYFLFKCGYYAGIKSQKCGQA